MEDKKYNEESETKFQFFKRTLIKRDTGEVYLDRLTIIRCFLGAIMFHKIYLTDNDCMHDHPWSFVTLLVKGGYIEHTPEGATYYSAGTVLVRPAEFVHRLEVEEPTWTLVFTKPARRTWGFFTPKGWVRWFLYKNTNSCE